MEESEPLLVEHAERLAEGFCRMVASSTLKGGVDLQLGSTPADEIIETDDLHTTGEQDRLPRQVCS